MRNIAPYMFILLCIPLLWAQDLIDPRARNHFDTALSSSNLDNMQANLEAALLYQPDYIAAHLELGKVYLLQRKYRDAKAQFNKILDIKPNDAPAYNELGNIYFVEEAYDEALNSYKLALKFDNNFMIAKDNIRKVENRLQVIDFYQRAQAALTNNQWAIALENYSKVYNLEPDYKDVKRRRDEISALEINYDTGLQRLTLANNNPGKEQYEIALQSFNTVLNINPSYKETQSKIHEIERKIESLTTREENYSNGMIALNMARRNPSERNYQVALNHFSRINNPDSETRSLIAECIRKIDELGGATAEDLNQTGLNFIHQGIMDSAIVYFKKALTRKSSNPDAVQNLQYVLGEENINDNKLDAAKEAFEKVTSTSELWNKAQLGLKFVDAVTNLRQQKYDSARIIFEAIKTADSTYRITQISAYIKETENIIKPSVPIEKPITNLWRFIIAGLIIIFTVGITFIIRKRADKDSAMSPEISPKLSNDKIILNRYTDVVELGRGAMGYVYKAWDSKLEREIVLKTIRLDAAKNMDRYTEFKERFLREARAAGRLNHPNIVIIYDVEEAEGAFFISMEYLKGRDLKHILNAERLIAPRRAVKIITQCCQALDVAHEKGIVHRDIKPSNIMILNDDFVKIVDFGVAKLENTSITRIGTSIGTPSYMSPEQIEGDETDGRSDIFSLGVVFYEMLTGEKPFKGKTITTVISSILNDIPPSPTELKYHLPSKVDAIIEKMLAKSLKDRYAKTADVIADLNNIFRE